MDPLEALWRCQVPVQVTLAAHNISSPTSLPPLYFNAPRQGYLSSLAAQAWPFVQHVLSAIPGQPMRRPWFDYEGTPLRGQFPIGILYDLTTASAPQPSSPSSQDVTSGGSSVTARALPWRLTLHYSPPPHPHEEIMLNTQGAIATAAASVLFLNSLKEACFICQGSEGSSAAMRMAGGAQGDAMWNAIERGDLRRYRVALTSLRVKPSARQGTPPAVPLRIFVLPPDADQGTPLWDAVMATSRPIPAQNPDGSWTTLGDVICALLPGCITQQQQQRRQQQMKAQGERQELQVACQPQQVDQGTQGCLQQAGSPASSRVTDQPSAGGANQGPGLSGECGGKATARAQPGWGGALGAPGACVRGFEELAEGGQGDKRGGEAGGAPEQGSWYRGVEGEGSGGVIGSTGCSGPEAGGSGRAGQGKPAGRGATGVEGPQDPAVADGIARGRTSPLHGADGRQQAGRRDGREAGEWEAGVGLGPGEAGLEVRQQLPEERAVEQQAPLPASQDLCSKPCKGLRLLPMRRLDADGRRLEGGEQDCSVHVKGGRHALRVLVSGIEPPQDAPIAWLHANMHAPDYFLYILVL